VQVLATTSAVPDVQQRPATVLDGDPSTSWVANALDPDPALTLTFAAPRRLDGVRVFVDPFLVASRPRSVSVRVDGGAAQVVPLAADGLARLRSVEGYQVDVSFPEVERRLSVLRGGVVEGLPVGVTELGLLGPGPSPVQRLPREKAVDLPCGQGPLIEVNGELRGATAVKTTLGELLDGGPVTLEVCTGPLRLGAGVQHLRVARTATIQATGVRLADADRPMPLTAAGRVVVPEAWGDVHRTVEVGPGEESWLVVHEAFNAGWQATLDGQALVPVRLDGWQQGFLLPNGAGGRVTLRYAPDRLYRASLLAGAGLALLLVGGAALPGRSFVPFEHTRPVRRRRWAALSLSTSALTLLAGAAGLGALLIAYAVRRFHPTALAGLAAGAVAAAGVVVAFRPWPRDLVLQFPVQALCLFAVAAILVGEGASAQSGFRGRRSRSSRSFALPLHRRVLDQVQAEPGDEQAARDDDGSDAPELAGEER
jgi:arabinofuranan 3-O-arabinosyltransferase